MKKDYSIEVREILTRTVTVNAASYEEALREVKELYDNEKIVLDYNDHESTYFFSVRNNSEKEVAAV